MWSDYALNEYLRTVASGWIFISIMEITSNVFPKSWMNLSRPRAEMNETNTNLRLSQQS
jgi:hypothetical protein